MAFALTFEKKKSIIRAMSDKLPKIIDPVYFAQHEKEYVVKVPQSQFLRLSEQVNSTENDVNVSIRFYRHWQLRLPAFDLKLQTTLSLKCQRSLKLFEHDVEIAITGVFVKSILLAEDIVDSVEVYELSDDEVMLFDLIEDELLLDIPLSPIDDSSELEYENKEFEDKSSEENLIKKESPFAALKELQKGK